MSGRRGGDVDEVERLAPQQFVAPRVGAHAGNQLGRQGPARRVRIGHGDDLEVASIAPPGHMPVGGDVAEPDDATAPHCGPSRRGVRGNGHCRYTPDRATSAKTSSRIATPARASDSVRMSGGLMRTREK